MPLSKTRLLTMSATLHECTNDLSRLSSSARELGFRDLADELHNIGFDVANVSSALKAAAPEKSKKTTGASSKG